MQIKKMAPNLRNRTFCYPQNNSLEHIYHDTRSGENDCNIGGKRSQTSGRSHAHYFPVSHEQKTITTNNTEHRRRNHTSDEIRYLYTSRHIQYD